jgi:hypothetical protein
VEHGIHVENDRHMWEGDGRIKEKRKKMQNQDIRMWDNGRNSLDGKMGVG